MLVFTKRYVLTEFTHLLTYSESVTVGEPYASEYKKVEEVHFSLASAKLKRQNSEFITSSTCRF